MQDTHMPGKTLSRQNWPSITASLLWLLLSCLFANNSLAATNEPANQARQTESQADLEKVIEQVEKPVYSQTLEGAKQAHKDKKLS